MKRCLRLGLRPDPAGGAHDALVGWGGGVPSLMPLAPHFREPNSIVSAYTALVVFCRSIVDIVDTFHGARPPEIVG